MNKYPYYVAALMDAGVLRKIFNDTKFKSYNDAVNATKNRAERFEKFGGRNFFNSSQIVILEYTEIYKGRIVTIFTNGVPTIVTEPKVYSSEAD